MNSPPSRFIALDMFRGLDMLEFFRPTFLRQSRARVGMRLLTSVTLHTKTEKTDGRWSSLKLLTLKALLPMVG
jgi:hypothetical protein